MHCYQDGKLNFTRESHMHIHLFISKDAPAAKRFRAALQETLSTFPLIRYYDVEAIGCVIPAAYDDKAVAVVMASGNEELGKLAERKAFWDRVKTILVLPDSDPETISMGYTLKPRYISFIEENNFSDVVAILNHLRINTSSSTSIFQIS